MPQAPRCWSSALRSGIPFIPPPPAPSGAGRALPRSGQHMRLGEDAKHAACPGRRPPPVHPLRPRQTRLPHPWRSWTVEEHCVDSGAASGRAPRRPGRPARAHGRRPAARCRRNARRRPVPPRGSSTQRELTAKCGQDMSARTVRTSRRISRPTVRLRIQPTSWALRIASPRRWKRQVAKEKPKRRRAVSAATRTAAISGGTSAKSPVVSSARNSIVSGPPTTVTAMLLMPMMANACGRVQARG